MKHSPTGKWKVGLCILMTSLLCVSCTTKWLWEETHPNERVFIPADQITIEELGQRGVSYREYDGILGTGYLVDKDKGARMKGYIYRAFGTPVTVVIDTVSTGVVVVSVVGIIVAAVCLDIPFPPYY